MVQQNVLKSCPIYSPLADPGKYLLLHKNLQTAVINFITGIGLLGQEKLKNYKP